MLRLCSFALVAALALVAPAAATSVPSAGLAGPDAMWQAHVRLDELISDAERRGTLPRLRDDAARAVLLTVWDVGQVGVGREFTPAEILALSPVCAAGREVLDRYWTFRTRGYDDPAVAGNALMFQPEIARGTEFLLRCNALQVAGLAIMMRTEPPEGMHQVRGEYDRVRTAAMVNIAKAMLMIHGGYLRGDSVDRVALALNESAPRLLTELSVAERTEIAGFVHLAALHAESGARADLETFAAALAAP
jgi:hypothetical protein